jgi:hypothetical protein
LSAERSGPPARSSARPATGTLLLLLATAGCGADPTATAPSCEAAPALAAGVERHGALGPDHLRRGGSFIQYYAIHAPRPARARVRLTAARFEPVLLLFDDAGRAIDQAYDPTPGPGARSTELLRELAPGCHLLGATSWGREQSGEYALVLEWVVE